MYNKSLFLIAFLLKHLPPIKVFFTFLHIQFPGQWSTIFLLPRRYRKSKINQSNKLVFLISNQLICPQGENKFSSFSLFKSFPIKKLGNRSGITLTSFIIKSPKY